MPSPPAECQGPRDARLDARELWDPTTRQVVRRLPVAAIGDLGPTYRNLLASCTGGCGELRLTDLRSGDQRVVPRARGLRLRDHARRVLARGRDAGTPSQSTPARLGIRRPARARRPRQDEATLVAGSRVPSGYRFVAWSSSGDHVFITGGDRFDTRVIVAYRLGHEHARVVRVHVGDFYGLAAR